MTTTVVEALLQRIAAEGIRRVFGIPGNHTVPFYGAMDAQGVRHVTCRHEQGAAFMADGFARASGRPGVCLLVSGPGLLNAATAIAQARADSVPMLVVTGVAAVPDLGMARGNLHELPDQRAAARSFCRESHTLLDPDNLSALLDRAFAAFRTSRPGPVHIEIPLDLMGAAVTAPRSGAATLSPPGPAGDAVAAACRLLGEAKAPLVLTGGGAVAAGREIAVLAERLGAPVLNTVNAKGLLPHAHPLRVGGSPSLPVLRRAIDEADAVVALGTELSETDFDLLMGGRLPDTGRWVRVDIDPAQLVAPRPPAIGMVSDARLAAAALAAQLAENPDRLQAGRDRAGVLRAGVRREAHYHTEMTAFFEVIRSAAPDSVLVGDSTRPTYYAAWQYETDAPRRYFHSVSGFGTLGYALPAAFGAALAVENPVIALIGDGGAQFTLPELTTGAEAELPVPVLVWNNNGYREIENSMIARGVPAGSTRILAPDFAAAAAAHRCEYACPRTTDALGEALQAALAADRPTVIELMEADFLTEPSGQWYR